MSRAAQFSNGLWKFKDGKLVYATTADHCFCECENIQCPDTEMAALCFECTAPCGTACPPPGCVTVSLSGLTVPQLQLDDPFLDVVKLNVGAGVNATYELPWAISYCAYELVLIDPPWITVADDPNGVVDYVEAHLVFDPPTFSVRIAVVFTNTTVSEALYIVGGQTDTTPWPCYNSASPWTNIDDWTGGDPGDLPDIYHNEGAAHGRVLWTGGSGTVTNCCEEDI